MFGSIGTGSEIKHLAIVHTYIIGGNDVGGIAGIINNKVRNSVVSGSIGGMQNVGGIFGFQISGGNLRENNISSVSVKGTGVQVGIFSGSIPSLISNPLTFGNSIGVGSVVGNGIVGIVGYRQGSVNNLYNIFNNLRLSKYQWKFRCRRFNRATTN